MGVRVELAFLVRNEPLGARRAHDIEVIPRIAKKRSMRCLIWVEFYENWVVRYASIGTTRGSKSSYVPPFAVVAAGVAALARGLVEKDGLWGENSGLGDRCNYIRSTPGGRGIN